MEHKQELGEVGTSPEDPRGIGDGSPARGALIVVGDGTPDDIVCLILAHKHDGERVVGITKSEEKRIGALAAALTLFRKMKVKNLMVLLDQDGDELEALWERIEDKLRKENVGFEIELDEGRFRVYNCSQAPARSGCCS
ncbi:MAG: hypothetical protein ACXQTZ_00320 [Candidatus Alkanophagales archaeon]